MGVGKRGEEGRSHLPPKNLALALIFIIMIKKCSAQEEKTHRNIGYTSQAFSQKMKIRHPMGMFILNFIGD